MTILIGEICVSILGKAENSDDFNRAEYFWKPLYNMSC